MPLGSPLGGDPLAESAVIGHPKGSGQAGCPAAPLFALVPMAAPAPKNDASPAASKPYRRTRSDHASETAEDYVEAIAETISANGQCRNADLARLFAVSHVTVNKTIGRLEKEGLVATEPYAPVTLTAAGEKLAEESRQRHEVVLEFLLSLGVSRAVAEVDSEGIEHHVSAETLAAFKRRLGQK